tara:strand:- start:46 stop:1641 length:1596 start_codon:yes stop_codon:yes gene_type:complete
MLQEWVVTLHKKENLQSFYDDMETPGGNLFIPDREVGLTNRREVSRNTHYMLTSDEVEILRADERVLDCELTETILSSISPSGYTIENGRFSKATLLTGSLNPKLNWGLLRNSEEVNRPDWGVDNVREIFTDLTTTASGRNVDVIIVDGYINPAHSEFLDGISTRVNQYNWFIVDPDVVPASTYVYGPYAGDNSDHGTHVGGIAAGNVQGWARDAAIYNLNPYGGDANIAVNLLTMWDYMRKFHEIKPINPQTGRRNPTITNNSYASSVQPGVGNKGNVTRVNYRGVDFNPGRNLTLSELQARGFNAADLNPVIPYYFTSLAADIEDAIAEGILVVGAAGNEGWKTASLGDQDYNNTYEMTSDGVNTAYFLHRGSGAVQAYPSVINVGSLSNHTLEDKSYFSNCGSQVDIFAAGENIQSSTNPAYTRKSGTSMASPQVAGVLALMLETDQNMNQAGAMEWLLHNASTDQLFDSGTDIPFDRDSLQGAPNKLLRWENQRPVNGVTSPKVNFKIRPTAGITYPRRKLQKRGSS